MNKIKLSLMLLAASSMVAVAGTALAGPDPTLQSTDCGFMCHMPMAHQGGGGPMAWYSLGPKSGSFQQMKARLRIRADQEADWAAFEKVVFDQARSAREYHGKPPRTSLEKAEFMRGLWDKRTEQIKAVKGAFRTLLGKLDEVQQKIASRSLQFCEIPQ